MQKMQLNNFFKKLETYRIFNIVEAIRVQLGQFKVKVRHWISAQGGDHRRSL
jgi:hypothetical protein